MSWQSVRKTCKPLHSPDDREYEHGCMRKIKFNSLRDAEKAVAVMERQHKRAFNAYSCRFCQGVHVGGIQEEG